MAQRRVESGGESREAERRREILRAAISVFATKGYHGCRIADVAREAKVAYGLVYHYFQNKEALLQSVFDAGWGGFLARIREACEGPGALEEKLDRICEVAFEAYRVDPQGVRVLILEIARSPAGEQVNRRSAFAEVIGVCEAMFTRAQGRGELREGLDPRLCAALLFGSVETVLTAFVTGLFPPEGLAPARQQIARIFSAGLEARPLTPQRRISDEKLRG